MKQFFFFLAVTMIVSCGKSLDVDFPARYEFSEVEVLTADAYRYNGNGYDAVSMDEAGEPNTGGLSGGLSNLELVDDSTVKFNDGFKDIETAYSIDGTVIEFTGGGSQYRLTILDGGSSLTSMHVAGGPFSDIDPSGVASASCPDVDCDSPNPEEWIYAFNTDDLGFVLIYNDVYTKQ